jgi:hypothetical protein
LSGKEKQIQKIETMAANSEVANREKETKEIEDVTQNTSSLRPLSSLESRMLVEKMEHTSCQFQEELQFCEKLCNLIEKELESQWSESKESVRDRKSASVYVHDLVDILTVDQQVIIDLEDEWSEWLRDRLEKSGIQLYHTNGSYCAEYMGYRRDF